MWWDVGLGIQPNFRRIEVREARRGELGGWCFGRAGPQKRHDNGPAKNLHTSSRYTQEIRQHAHGVSALSSIPASAVEGHPSLLACLREQIGINPKVKSHIRSTSTFFDLVHPVAYLALRRVANTLNVAEHRTDRNRDAG